MGRRSNLVSPGRAPNFVAANLVALANFMRRIGTVRFKREHGLSLVEGWIVARLGAASGPLSVDALAGRAGLAQSQMSRAVADMVGKGMVLRRENRDNYREWQLDLSARGWSVYEDLMRDAPEYHAMLTRGLTNSEMQVLRKILPRLVENAQAILAQEQMRGHGG
jgi:DNA-binding MarR family transcriptional regulator